MKGVRWFLGATVITAACGGGAPSESAAPAQSAAPAPAYNYRPHSSLAEVMRAIPFPGSNTIFDAQQVDPGAPVKEGARETTTEKFASLYGGWQKVELAAVSLMETANLIMIPGRLCENGRPVPLDRADYQKGVAGLVAAGEAALKAAKAKNVDQVVEAAGTIAEACAACHEVYRDVDIAEGGAKRERCMPPPAGGPAK
ncbi:MAG: hypothetical protein FJW27_06125 [Acidimicrobiia bacterium]|nr:hypothetical protein [Acidimicrobiia bacterium]